MWELFLIGSAVLLFSLVSGRLKDSIITPPMAFAGFGLAAALGLDMIDAPISRGNIHLLAEITLVLVLFADAARIDLRLMLRDHNLPVRMLVVGMPLAILFGTALALILPLGLGLAEAALLAAILAPTDAALGQAVITNAKVPVRIRQALNIESGLNDGVAVPFVFVLAAMVAGSAHGTDLRSVVSFTSLQLVFGPLAGIAVGSLSARALKGAQAKGWLLGAFEGPAVLATVAVSYALAQLLGGNGFIAGFVSGLVFGYVLKDRCNFVLEFAESEGQMLVLLAFLAFGAVMLPDIAGHVDWMMVLYAVLSLSVVRMSAVAISLLGTGVSLRTMAFLGWFGPRGLASILFGLIVLEELDSPHAEVILTTTVVTVALSVVAHGLSAAPLARLYARLAREQGECAENMPVSEIPSRHGHVGG